MARTYRKALVKDGYLGRGNTARKGAAEMKKLDRRMKRREAGSIKRAAMREYEADIADAREDRFRLAMEEEYGHFGDDWEGYDDPMPEPDYGWDDYAYDIGYYDDYADYEDFYSETLDDCPYGASSYGEADSYYAAGRLTKGGFDRLDMSARVSTEDAGKTLGEILDEALKRGASL